MAAKPVIGINGDFRPAKKDQPSISWFHSGYYDSVAAAGGIPLLLPPLAADDDLKRLIGMIDGLVLAGCSLDLDPVRLGMEKHPATRVMPPRREDFDRRLARLAIEKKVPVLAIGAGMQLVNALCGGTLFAHVVEDVPRALHHRDPVEGMLRHALNIVPGSRMDEIYGPGEIRVNSCHHQAIDRVADGFRVTATSPDGVIEAIESTDARWYCVGVQFHPENETASALDLQVFEHFVQATRASAAEAPVIYKLPKAA